MLISLSLEFITTLTASFVKKACPEYDSKLYLMLWLQFRRCEEYPFIAITPRSTLTLNTSTFYGPFYESENELY